MRLFKRAPVPETPTLSVQVTHGGISIENATEDFASLLIQFWAQEFGDSEEAKKTPMGFSNAHMSEIESDTMIGDLGDLNPEPDDDDEEDDD